MHPTPAERRLTITNPDRLFRTSFWLAFATGMATTVAFPTVSSLLSMAVNSSLYFGGVRAAPAYTPLAGILSAVLFASLVVGIVGVGAWRATFAALARGERLHGISRLGLCLGIGILVGQQVSFVQASTLFPDFSQVPGIKAPPITALLALNVLWGIFVLVSMALFLSWIAAGASTWLEVAAAKHSPQSTYRLGLAIATGVFAVWLLAAFYVNVIRVQATTGTLTLSDIGDGFIRHPLILLVFLSLWAFPLAAWFRRGQAITVSDAAWAFLDLLPRPEGLSQRVPLRLGFALALGSASGIVFFALVLPMGLFSLHATMLIPIAALMQAVVAAVAAGWVKRQGALHGLCAAFAAGCVVAGGGILLIWVSAGTLDFVTIWHIFSAFVMAGAWLALPAALSVSALAGWLRSAGRQPSTVLPEVRDAPEAGV